MKSRVESDSWYRVAELRPVLHPQVRLHAHRYRGERWYVLHDAANGKSQRLSRAAYALVGRMDGEKTADAIWQEVFAELGDDAPTQDDAIRVLGVLHAADALQCGVSPDLAEMFARTRRREADEGWRRFLNPVMIRFPLVDPDAWLERWLPVAEPLVDRRIGYGALALIVCMGALALFHLETLASDARDVLFTRASFVVLALVYPLMKLIHELAHGFAAKYWGARVPEAGVTLLLGMPIPYVDASASAVFPNKRRRIAVAMAGVAAEMAFASLALVAWWLIEPGILRGLLAQLFFMGTLSTLLFNGNPLIKFDAYYALADVLEMPGLQERAKMYLQYLLERRGFGLDDARDPAFDEGEHAWLFGYAIASGLYRVVLVFTIAWLISGLSPFLGLALAMLWVGLRLGLPAVRGVAFLLTHPRLEHSRFRAVGLSALGALVVAFVVVVLPWPHRSMSEGVIWPPESAHLRPEADGFVAELLAKPGARVEAGQPLVRLSAPLAEARVEAHEARVLVLQRERQIERQRDRLRSRGLDQEIEVAKLALANARDQHGATLLRSPSRGVFVLPGGEDMLGRFVAKGEQVGYVVDRIRPTVRVALTQAQIKRLRERGAEVEVRVGASVASAEPARVVRQTPGATNLLPSPVLGVEGGGDFATHPMDETGMRTDVPVFHVDLELERPRHARVGERVYVRFEHGTTSLARIGFEWFSDLLLSRLGA